MICVAGFIALPAARAQIVPVSLVHADDAADSRIPHRGVLQELPRKEPRRAVKDAHVRLFTVMSAGVYSAAGLDMELTEALHKHIDERDPLARPLLLLPAPAYYISGALLATGLNWLGWKMERSSRWHKIWWVPQAASMAGNLAGYSYTRTHEGTR